MNQIECKEISFSSDTGEAVLTAYTVFPGVSLVYSAVHMDHFVLEEQDGRHMIEIHHCKEGCVEQVYDDEVFYLMPGDLAVAIRREPVFDYHFPLHHYHGITLLIDTDLAPKCFSEFLEDVRVRPMEVAGRLCRGRSSFYIRKQKYIEHILSELYTVPENIKKGYFKVKILELLLILSSINPEENEAEKRALPKEQIMLAKQAGEYLTKHMKERITIPELARELHVSETSLKNAFKAVYGVPVYSYTRIQKMHAAARLLAYEDCSVAEVAYELGYKNASKFADAFREVLEESPSEFRNRHRKR